MAVDHSHFIRGIKLFFYVVTFVAAGDAVMAAEHHSEPHPAVNHAAAPVSHGPGGMHPGFGGPHDGFHGGVGPHDDIRRNGGPHDAFRGHDVHRFGHDDLMRWRGGRWNHTCFDGRCGWWWLAGGQWYFYDSPVYPYPLAVSQLAYAEPVAVAPVLVAPPPLHVAPPPRPRYYCDNPQGYYPAVQNCNTQFRQVSQ
jgi:hypothetical protein